MATWRFTCKHAVSSDDLFLSVFHQVRLTKTWWPRRFQMKSTFYFHSSTPLVSLSPPTPLVLYPRNLPSRPPPHCMTPPALSGSCSWSNTPCCGWSNGTKSGVSVRFGPLQPATASWIQSADTSMESKTWWSCDVRWQSVDSDRSFLFDEWFVIGCRQWMLIKDWWQDAVVNKDFF